MMDPNLLLITEFRYWQNYKKYLNLMKKFIDKKISGTEFDDEFFQLWKADRDKSSSYTSEELFYITENFNLTEIEGFTSLINGVFIDCEFFEADPLVRDDHQISEEELRDYVKRTFLEIQSRYPSP